jgi:hypothetical protein
MLVCEKLPGFLDEDGLYQLVKDVLDLAVDGLKSRGYGEECMLNPLYKRVENRSNPAKRLLDLRNQGVDMKDIILEYGAIV